MVVREVLLRLGGVASRADLIRLTSRAEVERALRDGEVVAGRPGRYALPDADSYLRHGGTPGVLRGIARSARGHGAARMRRVVAEANGDAANPFESVLRAIALDVPGLTVVPQRIISTPTRCGKRSVSS